MVAPVVDFHREEGSPDIVNRGTIGDRKVEIVKLCWGTNPHARCDNGVDVTRAEDCPNIASKEANNTCSWKI